MAQIVGSVSLVPADTNGVSRGLITSLAPSTPALAATTVGRSGTLTGIATSAELFHFRWADATKLALIHRIQITIAPTVAFTASQIVEFTIGFYSSWTVSGSGGTANTVVKSRTTHSNSVAADIRTSNTAQLTTGTKTFGGNIGSLLSVVPAGALPSAGVFRYDSGAQDPAQYPLLVLGANEGIVVSNGVLLGAGGSLVFSIQVDWEEFPTAALTW